MCAVFRPIANDSGRPIDWLWPELIPFGGITILDGDPGLGKSSIAEYLTAQVTTGRPVFGQAAGRPPAGVILIQAEDAEHITRANLAAANAAIERVFVYDRSAPLQLPNDLGDLEAALTEHQVRLVVIDPISAFLLGSMNNDQSVRQSLTPLTAIAERTGAAIILVRHLNQSGRSNPMYRGSGSIGIIAAARSGLLVAADPALGGQRVIVQYKSNLGRLGMAFRSKFRNVRMAGSWSGSDRRPIPPTKCLVRMDRGAAQRYRRPFTCCSPY